MRKDFLSKELFKFIIEESIFIVNLSPSKGNFSQ